MTETISAIEKLFTENALTSNAILEKVIELGIDFLAWKDVEKSQVEVTRILGGQSNHMFHITTSLDGPTDFLLRIHRQIPSHVFKDTVNFAIFSERGLGPKLYGFCDGARLEEYLPSKTMTVETILNPEITRKIGAVFPRYHAIEMPFPKSRRCIQVMREWLEEYKRLGGTDYQINARTVSWRDHPATVSVEELSREIDGFEKWAKEIYEHTLVYSHNDLACGNVLELDATGEIVLIDWEFATYNWRGFDLAMHLAETGIDYTVPFPPGVKFNEQLAENHPNLSIFCEAYVDADNQVKNRTPEDRQSEIDNLIEECQFFWPLVHLFWTMQSLMYHILKYDNGVVQDVAASDRLAVYFHLKPRSERIYEKVIGQKHAN